jgi:glycosyltransferase involved in cell wall biosynthesis
MVVLNSVREGFGLALTEAMLCGTSVIGADSGGITDIIEHEKRGLLVKPDDIERLAQAMNRLLRDATLRDRLARAGFEFAVVNYSSRASAAKYAEIIREGVYGAKRSSPQS